MKRFLSVIISVVLMLSLVACGNGSKKEEPKKEEKKEKITVFAASSLTEVMDDLKKEFEKENKNREIVANFGGSSTLRTQIESGADFDLFLSADKGHYSKLNEKSLVNEGKVMAFNEVVLVVNKDNKTINSLEDLTSVEKLVMSAEEVPIGKYSRKIIDKVDKENKGFKDKVMAKVVSNEANVKMALNKVKIKEGDATFVYLTDVTDDVKDSIKEIEIKENLNEKAEYWMATNSKKKELGDEFMKFIESEKGKEIIKKHKFKI
ncbi:molybdate ABC transporter substrate-binding protein [Clostridium hydrogeniformans]|uniref:molybdate ABC transporter substrate-binding protein n=1 Tax=Clostridium hydrogeniformans TaxID=349933 RepID=UPI0004895A52|nr:molybdate ABC transporter substrate-binding protein [Clostridium hydrogeniformans]